jgi:protein-disulfide isomerase
VTVVQFSDFECPYCARGEANIAQLVSQFGREVRVVAKQLPLPMHSRARPAALAALAAQEQGKYWEMHRALFQNSKDLSAEAIERKASEIGLDVARWKAALADAKLEERLRRDEAQAQALGVRGTPAFFINGRKVVGAQPVDVLKPIVEEELKNARALLAAGTRAEAIYETLQAKIPAPAAAQQ